jgi:hypothetical protein
MAGWGQAVEIGVQGGIPLTPSFDTSSELHIDFGEGATSATRRYTVGPMVRVSLPHGFGLEFDALYKHLGYDDTQKVGGLEFIYTREIDNSWEFPVLGTFRFLGRLPAKPYISAGPSFRVTSATSLSTTATLFSGFPLPGSYQVPTTLVHRSWYGAGVGMGGEFQAGLLRILPGIRYTRWAADAREDPFLHSGQNQVEFLLGFAIKAK